MNRFTETEKLRRALRQVVVPYLKQQGFRGTFPHFRRFSETRVDLLSFALDVGSSQSFYVAFASSGPHGIVHGPDIIIPPNRLTAYSGVFNGTFRTLSPVESNSHVVASSTSLMLEEPFGDVHRAGSLFHPDDSTHTEFVSNILRLLQERADPIFEELAFASRGRAR